MPFNRWIRAVCPWILAIFLLIHLTPLVPWIAFRLSDNWSTPGASDVLVILGADLLGDGTLGVGSYWRAVYGVRAWRAGRHRMVILCGGTPPGHPQSVAAAMADFLVSQGVPRDRLMLEESSQNTFENAQQAARLLPREYVGTGRPVVLVTSDFHMYRARRAFARAGITAEPLPFPDIGKRWSQPSHRPDCSFTVFMELVKIAYYRFRGRI